MESKSGEVIDIETAIAYAQLAVHFLRKADTEITDKSLREEIKSLHKKFDTKEAKKIINIIVKGKK